MLIEAEAIPYEPAHLRGEKLMVLAPHPDDEVIGCGGLVALHLRDRRPVRVIVATDGAQAGDASRREAESRRALSILGPAEIEFLRFPDRGLSDDAAARIREELASFRPDLVLVPSPIEIHPDHAALARVFCELIQRDEKLFAELAVTRVAFYEVGQPLRPNAIVDISDVASAKYEAIEAHASQLEMRDYAGYARGLNAYRAMTLPAGTKFAEAYYVMDLAALRTAAWSELRTMVGAPPDIAVGENRLPVSVVIRTRDRPALLREAIDSVRVTGYPCEMVVVNDGGSLDMSGYGDVKWVHHETSRGRSAAANAGVHAASNPYVSFLDDDDLFLPEHLHTLTSAATSSHAAWYSDAVSAFLRPSEDGRYETHSRLRIYAQDFDRDLLLLDNYIPLPTLLMRREDFLAAGGFDPEFDLFEDWDFLIRLAQRGDFLRIPRVTCEIRHFEGGSSVVLAAPEGSKRFRDAKLQVWKKHAALIGNDSIANAFELQKKRAASVYSSFVETAGLLADARRQITQSSRDNAGLQDSVNGYMLHVRELEGALAALKDLVPELTRKTVEVERLTREGEELRASQLAAGDDLRRAHVEIERLNGLLEMIYRSRTWKVHTMLEKARGRG